MGDPGTTSGSDTSTAETMEHLCLEGVIRVVDHSRVSRRNWYLTPLSIARVRELLQLSRLANVCGSTTLTHHFFCKMRLFVVRLR